MDVFSKSENLIRCICFFGMAFLCHLHFFTRFCSILFFAKSFLLWFSYDHVSCRDSGKLYIKSYQWISYSQLYICFKIQIQWKITELVWSHICRFFDCYTGGVNWIEHWCYTNSHLNSNQYTRNKSLILFRLLSFPGSLTFTIADYIITFIA